MTPKEFQKYMKRDGYCLHCGEADAVSPNHRANRGMGGSKKRDVPSNIVVLCSEMNGRIESDPTSADLARRHGWKLSSWEDPLAVPVVDLISGAAYLLDDEYGRSKVVS